jgi:solute:Na+ symporter, SSS family
MDIAVIAFYLLVMLAVGWFSRRKARNEADFLVAGRRLGPVLYACTMAALVMGGGSTVGGVALGYQYGISGMWMVFSLALGVLTISVLFSPLIARLRVYTVAQMLELRYGPGASLLTGAVLFAYVLMIAVTSTIAYGSIFGVLFSMSKIPSILLGGGVVLVYCAFGGMWSISINDFLQFIVKTVGFIFIMLPAVFLRAGGFAGLHAKLPETAFSLTHIGLDTMFSYFLLYVLSIWVGQDVWQRIFTARSVPVAKWGGAAAGGYCFIYAITGAIIGMSAHALMPGIVERDHVYTEIVRATLPAGLSGLVIAAALASVMSTSSGALIAATTVVKEDLVRTLRGQPLQAQDSASEAGAAQEVQSSRGYLLGVGVLMIILACTIHDVVAGLTIACGTLLVGLFVPVVGGIVWQRATFKGAVASVVAGIALTLISMAIMRDIYANIPLYIGLSGSFVAFVVVSLIDRPMPPEILANWLERAWPARTLHQNGRSMLEGGTLDSRGTPL